MLRKQFNTELFMASIESVLNWLSNSWSTNFPDSTPLTVNLIRNADDLRSFKSSEDSKLDSGESAQLQFPLAILSVVSMEPITAKNAFNQKHVNTVVGRKEDSSKVEVYNMMPVRVGIGLRFRTSNFIHVVQLCHMLMFAMPKININLQNDTGYVFQCSVSLDSNFSIPAADLGSYAKEFVFETTMLLDTMLVMAGEQGVIRTITFQVSDSHDVYSGGGVIDLEKIERNYLDLFNKSKPDYRPET